MNRALAEIRRNLSLWLRVFVPAAFVVEAPAPKAATALPRA
jgi:hypothetical protein